MKTRKPMKLETIPAWAIDAGERSRHTIAAAFELADLYSRWVRLTADTQRALFGMVMFGKCQIFVSATGIKAVRSVCFGTDFSCITMDWNDVERHISNQTKPCI